MQRMQPLGLPWAGRNAGPSPAAAEATSIPTLRSGLQPRGEASIGGEGQAGHCSPRLCSHPSLITDTSLMLLPPRGTERGCCLPGGPEVAWRPAGEKGTAAVLRTFRVATLKPCYPLSTAEQTQLLNALKFLMKPQSTPACLSPDPSSALASG